MHKTSRIWTASTVAFGKVIEGLEIVDKIANVRTDYSDRPLEKTADQIHDSGNLRRRLPGTGEVLNEKRIADGKQHPRLSFFIPCLLSSVTNLSQFTLSAFLRKQFLQIGNIFSPYPVPAPAFPGWSGWCSRRRWAGGTSRYRFHPCRWPSFPD